MQHIRHDNTISLIQLGQYFSLKSFDKKRFTDILPLTDIVESVKKSPDECHRKESAIKGLPVGTGNEKISTIWIN